MSGDPTRRRQGRVVDRQAKILQILRTEGAVSVSALARRLACSPMTIRRDLAVLARAQGMTRYHGTVAARALVLESGFREQMEAAADEKATIAQAAHDMVEPGSVIGLNAGTTTTRLAEYLAADPKSVTVVTNAVNIAMLLIHAGVPVVVVGGALGSPRYGTSGPAAERQLDNLHLRDAFLGVSGVHPQFGFSTRSAPAAAIGAAFARAAERVTVLADSRKFGECATYRMLAWERVHMVVSDPAAREQAGAWADDIRLACRQHGAALVWTPV
ncbi:MAG: DeoR/GlpR family DNA-binding transcription regulator [Clostridia bacterium]